MNTFYPSKPYGMGIETGHTALVLSKHTAEERRGSLLPPLVQARFLLGEYVLLYPYWYRANEQGILQCVGRSRVPAREAGSTLVADWRLDAETLLARPLPRYMAYQIRNLTFVYILNLRYLVALALTGKEFPQGPFPPCSYVLLGTPLYATDPQGCLTSYLGEIYGQPLRNEPAFHRRLKTLTGIDSRKDIQPLRVTRGRVY
jgi:hypothetical protein